MMISGNVTEARDATCADTALPPMVDTPRSPCSNPSIQSPYCATYDLSKPSSVRSDAIRSGAAFVPAITAATSPGSMRNSTNTRSDRPNRATTNSPSRLTTNLIVEPPLVYRSIRAFAAIRTYSPSLPYPTISRQRVAVPQRCRCKHRHTSVFITCFPPIFHRFSSIHRALVICHNGSTVWLSLLGNPCTFLWYATVTRYPNSQSAGASSLTAFAACFR